MSLKRASDLLEVKPDMAKVKASSPSHRRIDCNNPLPVPNHFQSKEINLPENTRNPHSISLKWTKSMNKRLVNFMRKPILTCNNDYPLEIG